MVAQLWKADMAPRSAHSLETLHLHEKRALHANRSSCSINSFCITVLTFSVISHPCGCHKPSSDLIAEQRNSASSTTRSSRDFFPIPKFLSAESANLLCSFQTRPYLATTIPGIVDEQEMSDIWLVHQANFAREQQLWVWRYRSVWIDETVWPCAACSDSNSEMDHCTF